jgi:signal transduction histidine kinase/CHASE3 domain sensor protein
MSLRTRLTIFLLLFGIAVFTNIVALLYLARAVSTSLDSMERIRQRQLLAVQMDAHLRDAESALYRYQIIGETGYKSQFKEQFNNFAEDLDQYHLLVSDPQEQNWFTTLKTAQEQAQRTGNELITLRDQQTNDLQTFFDKQAQLTDLLLSRAKPSRSEDIAYQASITAMQDASRAMFSAVTGYIASPDETKRVRFTDAIVIFRQAVNDFSSLAETENDRALGLEIIRIFDQMEALGSKLIGQHDLQQSLYAHFTTIIFNAGQQTIEGQIEPHEAVKFTTEQQSLLQAVRNAILISVLVAVLISISTITSIGYLTRQVNNRVNALLQGAERVANGNLLHPVDISGVDEFGRLAMSFNNMMMELASRQERLRALIVKMARIQDEERRLIGLDLHDGLTQLVISANMHLNTLNSRIGSKLDPEATQELDVSRTLVKQSIDEARKVIAELRPTVIEDFGLKEGLRRYLADICESHKWEYEIIIEVNEWEIPPSVQAAFFRIVQEAMSNIRKHANTLRVRLVLHEQNKSLFLRVQDWGQGFDAGISEDDLSHLGLVSMRERAQMLGGSCQIQSKKGEGTVVTVMIPLTTLAERNVNATK